MPFELFDGPLWVEALGAALFVGTIVAGALLLPGRARRRRPRGRFVDDAVCRDAARLVAAEPLAAGDYVVLDEQGRARKGGHHGR